MRLIVRDPRAGRAELNEEIVRGFLETAYPRLVANLVLVTGSREEAEDVVQEGLARAWDRSERGEEIRSLESWVAVVAVNLARSRFRRVGAERRARARLEAAAELEPLSVGWEPEELSDVRRAVLDLPRRQREAVVLRYYLELPVEEVAAALGVGEGTAKKALFRAREALSRSLAPDTLRSGDGLA